MNSHAQQHVFVKGYLMEVILTAPIISPFKPNMVTLMGMDEYIYNVINVIPSQDKCCLLALSKFVYINIIDGML
jgi:hypothetical protein